MWVLVILGFLLFPPLQASNDGNCQIENIKSAEWAVVFQPTKTVYDNEAGVEIFKSPFTGKVENLKCTCLACKHEYVNFEANDSIFLISTTNFITELDSDTVKTTSSSVELNYVCNMNCNNDKPSKLSVLIKINDYNNHPPEFLETSYKYTVPFPIMHQTDFTLNDVKIEAGDLDFSNQNMTFTITPNDFDIFTTVDNANSKKYIANFRANKNIQANGVREYKLIATDSGTYPSTSSSTVSVTIDVDGSSSLDVPSFIYPDSSTDAYSFNYESDGSLKPLTGDIKVQTDRTDPSTLKLSGEYSEHFEVSFEAATKIVTLSTKSKIENPTSSSSIITLHFKTDVEISAPIIINFSDVSMSSITFNKHVYTGSYTDKDTVKLDQDITVVTSETGLPEVTLLSGDFSKHFDIKYDESSKTCSISTKTPLTVEDIKSNSYIKLDLNVALDKYSDTSSLILKLPVYTLQFTDVLYLAQYTKDNKVNVAEDKPIAFTTETSGVKISVETAYETYFSVNDDYTINVKNSLPADTLSTNTEIAVILTANDKYENQPQAVLKIILPLEDTNRAPKFSQPFYQIQYGIDDSGFLDFADPIAFDNVVDPLTVKLSLNSYSEYFQLVYDNNKWRFKILKTLDTDTFEKYSELILTMEASEANIETKGLGVLVVVFKKAKSPAFSDYFYVVKYLEHQTGFIDFQTPLVIDNVDDVSKVTIQLSSYQENFDITYNASISNWQIVIEKPLDPTIFESNSEIVTTMVASETGNPAKGEGVLVIELKSDQIPAAPQFSDPYYVVQDTQGQTAKFNNTTGRVEGETKNKWNVNLAKNKRFKYLTTVNSIYEGYQENFDITYNASISNWQIVIKKPLDSSKFASNTEIVTTMVASETDNPAKGEGVLVIELKSDQNQAAPQFSDPYYVVQDIQGQTGYIDFKNPVSFKNSDPAKISIVLSTYQENFDIAYNVSTLNWQIVINKPLDSSMFASNTEIVTTMVASETDNPAKGEGVLVIELKSDQNQAAPQFSDPYYVAQDIQGQTGYIDFKNPIWFKNSDDDKISIVLSTYQENFDITYNVSTSKWQIVINKPLNSSMFASNTEIVTTMVASETDNPAKGEGVLVIELKSDQNQAAPQFSDPYYIVQDSQEQTGYIDFKNPVLFKDSDPAKISIVLSSYQENFNVTYDEKTSSWHISIKTQLDTNVFDSNSEIVTTMIASEDGNPKTGEAVLVIELKSSDSQEEPKFSNPYYEVEYKEDQIGYLDFKESVAFKNENDPTKIDILLSTYHENFDVVYDQSQKKWRLKITHPLSSDVFDKTSEIVTTMEASEKDIAKKGIGVLVIELKRNNVDNEPNFSDAYYTVRYNGSEKDYLDFDNAITFTNADLTKVSIVLDDYAEYFKPVIESGKWRLKILNRPDDTILNGNAELVTVMEARLSDSQPAGKAVLVIELVQKSPNQPAFKDVYYTAEYPKDGKGTINFDTDIIFNNVDDITAVSISISGYSNNFEVKYDNGASKWSINIKNPLDDTILSTQTYITTTLVANINGDSVHVPTSAFILKLPEHEIQEAPTFSKSYYKAEYSMKDSTPICTFTDEIGFSNDVDPTKITIAADEYSNKFTFKYDKDSKKWNVKVEEPLDVNILDRTDLVVSITASDTATKLQSHSVIDLKLPNVNTDGAPKFSKTYYKAKYEIADGTSTVTLLDPLDILNVDPDATISITTDTYTDNFAILKEHGEWVITVTKALDEEILNSHVDIVMGLIVTVKTNTDEIGQAALVITLPLINNNEAPKFSSIFYSSETNQTTAILDRPIKIMNKPDLTKITVNILEDAYKKYFDVKYDETTQSWKIVVQSLPIDVMQDKNPLVLTLHAEEKENTNIGQASLVLNFPIMEAPTFSSNQYYGTYSEKNELTVESIGIPNKNNPDDIELKLVSSETDVTEYFKFTYDKTKHVWQIGLNKPFNDDMTNGKSELVLTLSAIEKHNEKVGYATVIIQLSSSVNNGDLSFSEVLYEGDYDSTGDTPVVTLNHVIKLISKEDLSKANVTLKNSDDFDSNKYFKIEISSPGIYKLSVKKSVTDDILQKQKSLAFTLEASLDSYKSYSSIILRVVENSIEFSKILYNGKYVVDDNSFTVEDIALITKEDSSKINVFISEDSAYAKYFGISQKDDVVTVKIEETIPSDLLKDIFVIPLTLIANSSTTSKSGTAVLIIDVQNGDDIVDNRKIAFESFIYNGKYTVENNVPTISTDTIKLDTNQGDENITTHIQSPYNTYFEVHYTNKVITIDLKSNVDNLNLRKKNNIPVVVVAEIIGSNHVATTVVNFEVVDKDNSEKHNGTISFPQLIYNGEYDIDVTTFKMITSVNVITDYTEDEIDIQLTNDAGYEKYFTWQYNHGTITISLKETLPKKEMEKLGFMALEITVSSKENNAVPAEAVLNVKIKRKTIATEMSQTGYIVAVSILAALLFLLIAGTIAFYFFKIRNSKYQKMSEEEYVNKVRFDKSSLKRDTSKRSSALDERRPTGFIFNSNNKVDEEVRDSSTDIPDMSAERKKSVAFDEHVEKLQIETVADDEVDKASIENKTDDSI